LHVDFLNEGLVFIDTISYRYIRTVNQEFICCLVILTNKGS